MEAKRKNPMIIRPIASSTRQGIAPCLGIGDAFSVVVFFLIFVAAMHGDSFETSLAHEPEQRSGSPMNCQKLLLKQTIKSRTRIVCIARRRHPAGFKYPRHI
jgi:hypothetical protein